MKTTAPEGLGLDWRRTAAWVAGLVLLAWLACFRFPAVWAVTGIGEANRPFMDLYGILAACDAAKAGVDPFLPNSFDPYHRPHVYTEWWLELGRLGLSRADTPWLGATLLGTVLLAAMVMARPRTRAQGMALLLLLVSPAFLMAVNRANNDLVVFVLISGGLLCFRREAWAGRALGVVLFAVSAVLKYYPLVTLVVLVELRSRRGLAAGLALYGLVLVLAWPGLQPGLQGAARFMSQPEWLYAFGAPVFLRNLGVTSTIGWVAPAGLMTLSAVWSAWKKAGEPAVIGSASDQAAEREFMVGAVMLAGMFFLGSSFVYKLVFAIWLLPWLWREHADPVEARWVRAAAWLMLAVVWFEGTAAVGLNLLLGPQALSLAMTLLKGALLISQLLAWAWVACLLRLFFVLLGRRLMAWGPTVWPARGGRA